MPTFFDLGPLIEALSQDPGNIEIKSSQNTFIIPSTDLLKVIRKFQTREAFLCRNSEKHREVVSFLPGEEPTIVKSDLVEKAKRPTMAEVIAFLKEQIDPATNKKIKIRSREPKERVLEIYRNYTREGIIPYQFGVL